MVSRKEAIKDVGTAFSETLEGLTPEQQRAVERVGREFAPDDDTVAPETNGTDTDRTSRKKARTGGGATFGRNDEECAYSATSTLWSIQIISGGGANFDAGSWLRVFSQ